MLNFSSFQEYVRDHIKEYLPSEFADAKVTLNTVNKNNGIELHAINIHCKDANVLPNIYLDGFYETYSESGMEIEVVMEQVAKMELEHVDPPEEFAEVAKNFQDTDYIKEHVVIAIVNAEKNKEKLLDIPHKMKEDLAIIYKVYLGGDSDGIGTITIRNEHMSQWDITLDELHECAMENSKVLMPVKVQDMGSLLGEMMGGFVDEVPVVAEDKMMYVISNEQKVNGAASIIYSDALEQISEKLGTDLYILPSSIHETIAISSEFGTPEELAQMVHEVNATQVSEEEQLSDHVYKFDAKTKTLSLADVSVQDLNLKVSEDITPYETVNPEVSKPRHHR